MTIGLCKGRMRPMAGADVEPEALSALRRGHIVCIPTETSYGLAVDAMSISGLALLSALKERVPGSPFGLIAGDVSQARQLTTGWPDAARRLVSTHWPGPLTLVLPARADLPDAIVGPGGGVGVRVSSHLVPVALARALGRPITATSANPRGLAPAHDALAARAYFGDRVAHYIDAGPAPGERPSTVVAVSESGELTVLRAGPVDVS